VGVWAARANTLRHGTQTERKLHCLQRRDQQHRRTFAQPPLQTLATLNSPLVMHGIELRHAILNDLIMDILWAGANILNLACQEPVVVFAFNCVYDVRISDTMSIC
jgi:hypothetical protein